MGRFSNLVGFDDAPFAPDHRGPVQVVGCVCARTRLDVVLATEVQRDGDNATDALVQVIAGESRLQHLQAVILQGIALAGFNVVDVLRLSKELSLPVLVVARRAPNLEAVFRALENVPDHATKRRLIEKAGPMEAVSWEGANGNGVRSLHVQRVGLSIEETRQLLTNATTDGSLPEPVRLAHVIAGGIGRGISSRGRA